MKNPHRSPVAFLVAIAAISLFAPSAHANIAPPAPAAPVATAPVEAPAPAPAAPAAPAPHARREDEDPAATTAKRPGFIARLLGGGNAPDPLAIANQTITSLRAQLTEAQSALTTARAELAAAQTDLTEAGDYIQSMAQGTLNPVATPPPANPVAAAAVEAITAHQTQAIRRIGIPAANLETPGAPTAAPAITPEDPTAAATRAEEAKNNQLKAIWAARGYQFPGTAN